MGQGGILEWHADMPSLSCCQHCLRVMCREVQPCQVLLAMQQGSSAAFRRLLARRVGGQDNACAIPAECSIQKGAAQDVTVFVRQVRQSPGRAVCRRSAAQPPLQARALCTIGGIAHRWRAYCDAEAVRRAHAHTLAHEIVSTGSSRAMYEGRRLVATNAAWACVPISRQRISIRGCPPPIPQLRLPSDTST